jgi:hypothetical protein
VSEAGAGGHRGVSEASAGGPRGASTLLSQWSLAAAFLAAAAFLFERSRIQGYAAFYQVPREFIDIDPRLAYIPVLRGVVPIAAALLVGILALRLLRRAREAAGPTRPPRVDGRAAAVFWRALGVTSQAMASIFLVASLLLAISSAGEYVGKWQAAGRETFFIIGSSNNRSATVVIFMRDDTLLVRQANRPSSSQQWQMSTQFRFLPISSAGPLSRVRLGKIAPPPGGLVVTP